MKSSPAGGMFYAFSLAIIFIIFIPFLNQFNFFNYFKILQLILILGHSPAINSCF